MAARRPIVLAVVVAWTVVVVVYGILERRRVLGLPTGWAEPVQHLVSFAVLGALLALVVEGRRVRLVVALVSAGLLGEIAQLATDRTFSLSDLAWDAAGAVIGVGIVALLGPGRRTDVAVLGASLVVLAAVPFVLVTEDRPDTSFPDECREAPEPSGVEPSIVFSSEATDGGSVDVGGISAEGIRDRVVATDEFSVEVVFTSTDADQGGPARVFTISGGIDEDEVNLHVGVSADELSVRIRNSCELFNWIRIADVVAVGSRHTVVVTWSGGVAETWLDGTSIDRSELDWGDLTAWDPDYSVVVGDEVSGDRPFTGTVSSVTMWDRALPPSMIVARAEER